MIAYAISKAEPGSTPPARDVYSTFRISFDTPSGTPPQGIIEFRVSKEWLETNGYDAEQVVLAKLSSGGGIELPTEVLEETGNFVYYRATVESFSIFAIVVKKPPQAQASPEQTPEPVQSPAPTPTSLETLTPTPTPATTQTSPEAGEKQVPGFGLIGAVLATVIVLAHLRRNG
ncbi:MAG: PGF-pre-PGF domain-containing protein [Archaeoglobi archaeon]|nr:PGF-pre-PGF domain-containing protein [Archaeoglobi archaeon]